MKLIRGICFATVMLPFLFSCSTKTDDDLAFEEFDRLVECIGEKDDKKTKSLFSPNVVSRLDGFDDKVSALLGYVTGDYVSREYSRGQGTEETIIDVFTHIKFLYMCPFKLHTSDSNYYFSAWYCSVDDKDSKNIGLWNLRVQRYSEGEAYIPISNYDEWKSGDSYRGITFVN